MRKFKLVAVVGLLVFSAANAFATAQSPDRIIYNGTEYSLHSNPMEDYFDRFPGMKPETTVRSSGLWRGYIATFEFTEGSLFLKDIKVMTSGDKESGSSPFGWKSVIGDVVPEGEKLKIDWLTGILVIPHGEIINYVHMGYGSTYENYILVEVSMGDFVKAKEMDYKNYELFKDRQFEAFKKTDEYKVLVKEMKKDGDRSDKFIDSFVRDFVVSYTSTFLVD